MIQISYFLKRRKKKYKPELNIQKSFHFEISDVDPIYQCLQDHNWLTDHVIDSYLSILSKNAKSSFTITNTFFFRKLITKDFDGADKWSGIKSFLTKEKSKLLIPFSDKYHWSLGLVNQNNNTISIYDSLGLKHTKFIKILNNYFINRNYSEFKPLYPIVPHQNNSDDCGVFLLKYADCLLKGLDPKYISTKDISSYRQKIYFEIVQQN